MKPHVDVRLFIHLTMLAFAAGSLGNVRTFFASAGHENEVAWALAIALSSALVTLSIMLTHVDREADRTAFRWLLATALLLAAISGSLQMHVYEAHLPRNWAIALGYGIPICGEVALAFATSAYLKARQRERFQNMSSSIENSVVDHLEEALASFDANHIAGYVEETINTLTRLAMDSVKTKALSYYQTGNAVPDSTSQGEFGPQNLPSAQKARDEAAAANITQKKRAILDVLHTGGAANLTAISKAIEAHRQTTRKYLDELAEAGQIEMKNRKWQLVASDQ